MNCLRESHVFLYRMLEDSAFKRNGLSDLKKSCVLVLVSSEDDDDYGQGSDEYVIDEYIDDDDEDDIVVTGDEDDIFHNPHLFFLFLSPHLSF